MSKAILVIDMPENCKNCMCYVLGAKSNFCERTRFVISDNTTKPDWCPLKSLPNKRKEKYAADVGDRDCGFIDGWNACIDEILWQ